jgi:hypothetical protein
MSLTSKSVTRPAPLSPAISRLHVASTPQPSGVTMPKPVTTTRLNLSSFAGPIMGRLVADERL